VRSDATATAQVGEIDLSPDHWEILERDRDAATAEPGGGEGEGATSSGVPSRAVVW
jgi:hypothetical protein